MNVLPLPSPRQLAWHEKPFYGFVHLSPNTFTGKEWGYGDEDPAVFAPTALDCRQWARVAREGGMSRLVLTAQHHDGFCLWPSQWTEHCVRNSPWRGGRGDVVREFVDACAAEGIEAGLYLSPWDRNRADYGTPAYRDYYLRQLEELFTQYGPLAEVWFDGANGGDGFYGGARERRSIDQKSYYPWAEIVAARDRWQPRAALFGNFGGADLRWIGNEAGKSSDPCWCGFHDRWAEEDAAGLELLRHGDPAGAKWKPAEVDVSIRQDTHWFHRDGDAPIPLDWLVRIWKDSVGRGYGFILNLPPTREGLVSEADAARLRELRAETDKLLGPTLAEAQIGPCGGVALALPEGRTAHGIWIEEDIRQGQRVAAFAV
ncbi:MAG: alpha-L-fucosidase, partial [Kiritimatiellae bacterium]|nr:alpha-L-fucosidase [Kiritimatiellia bacterium]